MGSDTLIYPGAAKVQMIDNEVNNHSAECGVSRSDTNELLDVTTDVIILDFPRSQIQGGFSLVLSHIQKQNIKWSNLLTKIISPCNFG